MPLNVTLVKQGMEGRGFREKRKEDTAKLDFAHSTFLSDKLILNGIVSYCSLNVDLGVDLIDIKNNCQAK